MGVTRDEVVGMPTGKATIIERGPVTQFATSVTDANPIYRPGRRGEERRLREHPRPADVLLLRCDVRGAYPRINPPTRIPGATRRMEVIGKLMANAASSFTAGRVNRRFAYQQSPIDDG